MRQPGLATAKAKKPSVFVSYHHDGDQGFYDDFVKLFSATYDVISDNSPNRAVDSDDVDYVMRRIRENYITGSSCSVVLVGEHTWRRKYVDWEIDATLQKQHGLVGLQLPTLPVDNNGKVSVPLRLTDNIYSGYALWKTWNWLKQNPAQLPNWIKEAVMKSATLIKNDRDRRLRNA